MQCDTADVSLFLQLRFSPKVFQATKKYSRASAGDGWTDGLDVTDTVKLLPHDLKSKHFRGKI